MNDLINEAEIFFGKSFPDSYANFLRNGSGAILENGIVLYSIDDLVERNLTFEVLEYAQGYLAIGDDSGGACIMLSLEGFGVYTVSQGSMDPEDMELVSKSFDEWFSTVKRL